MRFSIYKDPDTKQDYIGYIHIKKEYTSKWYNEVMNRFKEHRNDVYDVDESFECGVMSLGHLQELCKFLRKN